MLAVGLREHHQLDVGRVACSAGEGGEQIIDFIVRQGQTKVGIGFFKRVLARTHDVDRDMFGLVRSHKGSVSAEHGIGLLKKEWLEYTRSPMEIDLMRHLKAALDPKGLLNPGKVL